MIQKVQSTKKKKIKFGKKTNIAKAFMNDKLTDLYSRLNIISLTIVPRGFKDSYDLLYVYEDKK